MSQYRLPDVIVHPTPLATEIAETPWHVAKSRITDVRTQYGVDGSGVPGGVADTGVDELHCKLGGLKGRVVRQVNFTSDGGMEGWDGHSHGTHVAGCILSMAPKVSLSSYKCLDDRGSGGEQEIAAALKTAADDGNWFVNGSFGSSVSSKVILDALEYCLARNCLPIIAAGNSGQDVQWPARSEFCFSTGATDDQDRIAPFSSRGPQVDVGYYGVRILSYGLRGGYLVQSGTSMSAPIFCGLLALRMQWEVIKFGSRKMLTLADLERWVTECSQDVGAPGRDDVFGIGIPDATRAFKADVPIPPPVSDGKLVDSWTTAGGKFTLYHKAAA